MNLHGIVRGAINAVNPDVPVDVWVSTGATRNADGSSTPKWSITRGVMAQVQPVDQPELEHSDALNMQGTLKAFYLRGAVASVVRVRGKGGDFIVMADQTFWLVTQVPEQFPDWCRAVGTLQNGAPT